MTHEDAHKSITSLLKIMQTLREPEGCPWDAEQTPESLTSYVLEESCELIDAIESCNPELILDELGDLLLQVVFLAQIYQERGQFNFSDVAAGIADKLVRRHPHVFKQEGVKVEADLNKQWDRIKKSEKTHNKTCLADHLPVKLPALQRAQKLISRAARDNRQIELPDSANSLLWTQNDTKNPDDKLKINEESLGQALFQIVKLAEEANLDAEASLRKTTRKIIDKLDNK